MSSKRDLISDHVRKFLTRLNTKTHQDKLFIGACTVELLRKAQQLDKSVVPAIVSFLARVNDVPWGDIPFSVTQYFLARGKEVAKQYGVADEHVPEVLLASLISFSDLVDGYLAADDVTPEALLDAIVAEEAEAFYNRQAQLSQPVEVYDHVMMRRCFKAAATNDKLFQFLDARYVTYRGNVAGQPGPILRGIAFDSVSRGWSTILETGELVFISLDDAGVVAATTPEDYANVCPALLAFLMLGLDELFAGAVISESARSVFVKNPNAVGELIVPVTAFTGARSAITALENVLNPEQSFSATGPTGASVRFQVPNASRPFCVVLDAQPSPDGPYVTARLVEEQPDGTEKVLMRLDHPRYFSARGFYLFPLEKEVICLRIVV